MIITPKVEWEAYVTRNNTITPLTIREGDKVRVLCYERTVEGRIEKLTRDEMYLITREYPLLTIHKLKIIGIKIIK